MLRQFLETVWAGEGQSLLEIARKMNISQEMVFQIAKDLTGKGYLQEIGAGCDTSQGCPECPVNNSCQTLGKHWFLTEKGRSVVSGQ
jgi:hypothetical protein